MIKKLLFLWVCCLSLCACGIYSTTQYNNTVDITQTDFSKIQDFKKASSCSYVVLGFIPWPWAEKTPDTLFEAIEQSGIKKWCLWIKPLITVLLMPAPASTHTVTK